jgi:copper chaperone CopZ
MAVQKNLAKLNLREFKVEIGSAKVEFDENKIKEELIIKAIEDAGFIVIK